MKTNFTEQAVFVALGILVLWLTMLTNSHLAHADSYHPQRICHNQESTEIVEVSYSEGFATDYPLDVEIVCENGVDVERYEQLGHQRLFPSSREPKTCIIKTVKEVCSLQ